MKFSLPYTALAFGLAAIASPQGWIVVGADAQISPSMTTNGALSTTTRPSTTTTRPSTTTTRPLTTTTRPSTTTRLPTTTARNPCAALSSSAKAYASQFPDESFIRFIPSHVNACQREVPINKTVAAAQVDWLRGYVQFQSNLAYLKNPPAGYDLPPVDVLGGLEAIKRKALSNSYAGEFDFELELYRLFFSTGDSHFSYAPKLISSFNVQRVPLVSVSLDGIQLPKVYFLSDIQRNASRIAGNFSFSAITRLDGEDATTYLLKLQSLTGFQTLDSRYNALFYNPATAEINGEGSFAADTATIYKNSMLVTFENGTSLNLTNRVTMPAATGFNFSSGQQIADALTLLPTVAPSSPATAEVPRVTRTGASTMNTATRAAASTSAPVVSTSPLPLGYPVPVIRHSKNAVSGYFLNETDLTDVAVLNVAGFLGGDSDGNAAAQEFQSVIARFLVLCKAANKSRLIIDVRGNPGGQITLGFDAFKQIFPKAPARSTFRFRAHDAAAIMTNQSSKLTGYDEKDPLTSGYITAFNSKLTSKTDGSRWRDGSELYGPQKVYNDSFSNLASFKFDNVTDNLSFGGIVVSGFANNSRLPEQVFKSENIILFTDAACSSTCTTFGNLLVDEGKVRTVTVGGRPNRDPIAALAGVQGYNVQSFSDLQTVVNGSLVTSRRTDSKAVADQNQRVLGPLLADPPLPPLKWQESSSAGQVNFLDSLRRDDALQLPRQFLKEFADCRIFYTPADVLRVRNTWVRVAGFWKNNGKDLCVATKTGSTANPSGSPSPSASASPTATPPAPPGPNASQTNLPVGLASRHMGSAGLAAFAGLLAACLLI